VPRLHLLCPGCGFPAYGVCGLRGQEPWRGDSDLERGSSRKKRDQNALGPPMRIKDLFPSLIAMKHSQCQRRVKRFIWPSIGIQGLYWCERYRRLWISRGTRVEFSTPGASSRHMELLLPAISWVERPLQMGHINEPRSCFLEWLRALRKQLLGPRLKTERLSPAGSWRSFFPPIQSRSTLPWLRNASGAKLCGGKRFLLSCLQHAPLPRSCCRTIATKSVGGPTDKTMEHFAKPCD